MKKLLIGAALVLTSLSVYAQGVILFGNDANTLVRFGNVVAPGDTTGNPVPGGGTADSRFVGQLYYLNDVTMNFEAVAGTFTSFGPASAPGRWRNQNATIPGETDAATLEVRVWERAYGASYEVAIDPANPQNAALGRPTYAGKSAVIPNAKLVLPPTPPMTLVSQGLQGFNVDVVPEPATIGLALLGALGLFLLRRRA